MNAITNANLQITAVCQETAALARESLGRLDARNATYSYVAKPADSRCKWWCKVIPAAVAATLDLTDRTSLHALEFVKKNADLELNEGDFVLDSEELHHRKSRGYRTVIGQVVRNPDGVLALHAPGWGAEGEAMRTPDMECKQAIKAAATREQWSQLSQGTGDVAACLRWAKARTMGVI